MNQNGWATQGLASGEAGREQQKRARADGLVLGLVLGLVFDWPQRGGGQPQQRSNHGTDKIQCSASQLVPGY